MKSECPKIVLALSAIIIVTYSVTIICLPRKSHYKLLSTDESKVTFYLDAMSWGDITPSLCLHMSVKSSTELMLYVVLTMPTLNKAYLLFIYYLLKNLN
jgi:hypothetical protein